MPKNRGLYSQLESRGGGGGVAASRKKGFPRAILVPSVKPWLMLNEVVTEDQVLEGGLNLGDYWPTHQGGYRLCQAKEPLAPARACFWAGPEEGRLSTAAAPTLIAAKRGDRSVLVETTASFEENEFFEGLLRVTGGLSTVTGRQFQIAYNEASYVSREISGEGVSQTRYATRIVLQDYIDVALDTDTDWHIQGNMFACARHAPGDVTGDADHTDQPRFTIGMPVTHVPEDAYFWCQVSGSGTGQLQNAMAAADVISAQIDLMPVVGTSGDSASNKAALGKLIPVDNAADVPSQVIARLLVRKETEFAADAYVPIWLYGNGAV